MKTTADPGVRAWLEFYLGTPAPEICRRLRLSPAELRLRLRGEIADLDRWCQAAPRLAATVPCADCGAPTAPNYGLRRVEGRALCALCALDAELGQEVPL
jgi:hypothetical protein